MPRNGRPATQTQEAPPRWQDRAGRKESKFLPEGYDMNTQTDAAQALAGLLRAAGDLIAAHPEIPTPYVTGISYSSGSGQAVELSWFIPISVSDPADQKRTAAQILKAIGGKWDKDPNPDERFNFTQVRGGLKLKVQVEREAVCERVVTGTTKVTIPARPAVPAVPESTIEREVVEWRCEPVLAEAAS